MRYKRILLKLSGEALGLAQPGLSKSGIDAAIVADIVQDLATVVQSGVQVGVVLGGGNWLRGAQAVSNSLRRTTADKLGMLATLMNAFMLRDALAKSNLDAIILSAISVDHWVEPFECERARDLLNQGHIVIFAGGTGHPFVSTDSAASLRALEIEADILLKATTVDGIYSADPLKDSKARRYDTISYDQVICKELKVMDLAAFMQCREYQLPICVFNIHQPHSLIDLLQGKPVGTLVTE